MEGKFNLESMTGFLQLACKSKQSIEEIDLLQIQQAAQHFSQLPTLKEKGLLINILTKLLRQKLQFFPQVLKHFQAKLIAAAKPTRMRRAVGEDGEQRRRRKRTLKGQDLDLNEIANLSITNPTGVVPPAPEQKSQDQDSKKSNPIPGARQDEVDPNEFRQAYEEAEQQYEASKNTSSAESEDTTSNSININKMGRFGAIPDFEKKMRILGDVSVIVSTVRRPRGPPATGIRTRRKEYEIDAKIDLDETGPTYAGETVDEVMENIRARHPNQEEKANFLEFQATMDTFQKRIYNNVFGETNRHKLLNFVKKVKEIKLQIKGPQHQGPLEMPQHDVNQDQGLPEQAIQYFNGSTAFEGPDTDFRELLETNIFRAQKKVSFKQVVKRTGMKKSQKLDAFCNLLWMEKEGTVHMQQENPEKFGDIFIQWTKGN